MNKLSLIIIATTFSFALNAQTPILSNPSVEKIAGGFQFVEGPLWVENLGLLFSDIPANKVYLLNTDSVLSEYITPSGKANGLALNNDGNLLLCQHQARQVGIYENNEINTIASHYDGKKLNSPNDLTIKTTGTIFFTDPDFGLENGETSELAYKGIFSVTNNGNVHLLDNSLDLPNGICFSPDESKLYVIDSEVADIYVWDVINDSTIENKTLFYNMNTQWGDGMKTDEQGFLYVTAANGVTIFSPEGEIVENIHVSSSNCSNCNWGSEQDEPTLYVTSGNSVYRLRNSSTTGFKSFPQQKPIKVYPNPSTQQITIVPSENILSLQILESTGKIVKTVNTNGSNSNTYNVDIMKHGVYFVVAEVGNKTYTDKVVIID